MHLQIKIMRKIVLFIIVSSFIFTSCLRRNYTCICTDASGNSITETGWYSGNDASGNLDRVETRLESEGNSNCTCTYD